MCGITGIFNLSRTDGVDRQALQAMADAMVHRGPDDAGFHVEDGLGLGFRRLSLIDLASGNQPLYNEDKTLVSICNGEIFNYQELKRNLIANGHRFYTHSDTEVLVHLYEEYGIDFLNKLNGQFAFALFDKNRQELFLVRDQAGIAPLFYTRVGGYFLFASEIKALLKHPMVKREVDLTGLDQIFSFPGLVSPRTMFKNISSLRPGHFIRVRHGDIAVREYWDLTYPERSEQEAAKPESVYIDALEALLRQSVRYRLLADVPVGFYLSGGLDSSLIAALIHDLRPQEQRHSFSICFPDTEIDERQYQRLMSRHVNSIHHEIEFAWPDISRRFRDMVVHAECPLKESYNTCSLALSEAVRAHGIKGILTGEGADELFAGYIGYRFDTQRTTSMSPSDEVYRVLEEQENDRLWGDRNFFYEIRQYELKETKLALYSEQVRCLFPEINCVREDLINKQKLHNRHPLHKRSYVDFKLRLGDHLLQDHGDRVAYANSIEVRYSFLDIDLLEFVKGLPPELKLNRLVEKYILKKVAEKYLPPPIINREKFGFVAPGSPYLLKRDIEWLQDVLSYERIKRQGYFDADTVERVKKLYIGEHFRLNLPFENDLLMIVITFGVFLDAFEMPVLA
jgi:asparagine synthase (glutamine-hydrolysing)